MPTVTGSLTVTTAGSSFDTMLAAYLDVDNTIADLQTQAVNDDCGNPYYDTVSGGVFDGASNSDSSSSSSVDYGPGT